jgi:hypothetical protein
MQAISERRRKARCPLRSFLTAQGWFHTQNGRDHRGEVVSLSASGIFLGISGSLVEDLKEGLPVEGIALDLPFWRWELSGQVARVVHMDQAASTPKPETCGVALCFEPLSYAVEEEIDRFVQDRLLEFGLT